MLVVWGLVLVALGVLVVCFCFLGLLVMETLFNVQCANFTSKRLVARKHVDEVYSV